MNSLNNRDAIVAMLTELGACDSDSGDALSWARSLPADTSPKAAWNACERGDWLVWLIGRLHERGTVTRQTLVLVACAAARTALVPLKGRAGEAAAVAVIETAERWTRREATFDEVIASRDAAWDARWTESDNAAVFAACTPISTAATFATFFANSASSYASIGDAVTSPEQRLADIAAAVRAAVPWSAVAAALGLDPQETG